MTQEQPLPPASVSGRRQTHFRAGTRPCSGRLAFEVARMTLWGYLVKHSHRARRPCDFQGRRQSSTLWPGTSARVESNRALFFCAQRARWHRRCTQRALSAGQKTSARRPHFPQIFEICGYFGLQALKRLEEHGNATAITTRLRGASGGELSQPPHAPVAQRTMHSRIRHLLLFVSRFRPEVQPRWSPKTTQTRPLFRPPLLSKRSARRSTSRPWPTWPSLAGAPRFRLEFSGGHRTASRHLRPDRPVSGQRASAGREIRAAGPRHRFFPRGFLPSLSSI